MKLFTYFRLALLSLVLAFFVNTASKADDQRHDPTKDAHSDSVAAQVDSSAIAVADSSAADEAEEEVEMGIFTLIKVFQLPRVYLGVLIVFVGVFLLVKRKMNRKIRFAFMALAFILFSVVGALNYNWIPRGFGLHPSPV